MCIYIYVKRNGYGKRLKQPLPVKGCGENLVFHIFDLHIYGWLPALGSKKTSTVMAAFSSFQNRCKGVTYLGGISYIELNSARKRQRSGQRSQCPYSVLMYDVDCTVLLQPYTAMLCATLCVLMRSMALQTGKTPVCTPARTCQRACRHTHTRMRLNWVQGKVWFILAIGERKHTSFSV